MRLVSPAMLIIIVILDILLLGYCSKVRKWHSINQGELSVAAIAGLNSRTTMGNDGFGYHAEKPAPCAVQEPIWQGSISGSTKRHGDHRGTSQHEDTVAVALLSSGGNVTFQQVNQR